LPRFYRFQQEIEDERKLARIILETGCAAPPRSAPGATAAGDSARMRGVPILGRGTSGTAPGTSPLGQLMRSENRRQR
jgi:hypothetical protein